MAKITIDGKAIEVPDGINVVDAAKIAGIEIPHYCYHPGLSIAGNCRMCLVEIEGMPGRGLPIACNTRVTEGMVIKTDTPAVKKARAGVLEFLLINHPLDCPICDKSGECKLQDFSFTYGNDHSRMIEQKEVMPKKDVSDRIVIFSDRCIMCTRCVRFCQEVTGTGELGVFNRGDRNEIEIFPGKPVDNLLAGNVVDICPVGALKSKDFLYKSRVWELRNVPTTCALCSAGCEIWADVRNNKIFRVRGRSTDVERGPWICDIGRYGLEYTSRADRLAEPMIRGDNGELSPAAWEEALAHIETKFNEIISRHGAKAIGGLLSTWHTIEEGKTFRTFFKETLGAEHAAFITGDEGEEIRFPGGFIIESDKSPNTYGLKELLPNAGDLFEAIEKGSLKALYFAAGEQLGPMTEAMKKALGKLEFLVVEDILPSDATAMADVVLPGLSFVEKRGTIKNSRGQERRFKNAILPPKNARDHQRILSDLARRMKAKAAVGVR